MYMIENGIPAEHILAEDRSTTTFENIANSKKIIDAREGHRYSALVTSNYHVYRALRYCKKSRTAMYRNRKPCSFLLLAVRFNPGICCSSRRKKTCSHAGGRVDSDTDSSDNPADAVLQVMKLLYLFSFLIYSIFYLISLRDQQFQCLFIVFFFNKNIICIICRYGKYSYLMFSKYSGQF